MPQYTYGKIVVNADDFGMSEKINHAIIRCFADGLISSATVMANMPGFQQACQLAGLYRLRECIGVHLNLTEGRPLTDRIRGNPRLCDADGNFQRNRPLLLTRRDRQQIAEEMHAQINRCRDAGLPLTHADSHQHVHTEPLVFAALTPVLRQQGIQILRITRNMHLTSKLTVKRSLKACFNRWLSVRGLRATDLFGTVPDFSRSVDGKLQSPPDAWDLYPSVEILTHPSMGSGGNIIDHLDGLPLADRLASAFAGVRLSSYGSRSTTSAMGRDAA